MTSQIAARSPDVGREGRSQGPVDRPVADLERVARLDPDQVYRALGSAQDGLDGETVRDRARAAGPNWIEEAPGPTLLHQVLAQFVHLFALLLWVGAGLALAAGEPGLAVAIVAVIVVNGLFGLWQEHRAERAVAALKRLLPGTALVMRNAREQPVPVEGVVPGDVLLLGEGDRVSADARLVETSDLMVDESALTGEAQPVLKSAQADLNASSSLLHAPNLVFAGSTVVSGNGRAVVARIGMTTQFGRIAQLTQRMEASPSPLQIEVAHVARQVAVLSVVMGAVFFAVGHWFAGLPLRDGAIFAVGIVLGNVPEGLLPTVTLALAMGVQRMAKRNAIVKRLSAVETLGCCSVICTDKTGTLTHNEMTVRSLWAGGRRARVAGSGFDPRGALQDERGPLDREDLPRFALLLRIGALCNRAQLQGPDNAHPGWHVLGDPTEGALLVAAVKAGLDRGDDLRCRPVARQLAFDAVRKRMSTLHREEDGSLVAYVKGAPAELLDCCTRIILDGRELNLTSAARDEVLAENDRLARDGLRVLGMAYRQLPTAMDGELGQLRPTEVERDLVFVGLVGMQDAPREGVREAMARARAAGVRVVMLTGDYGLTAESIARQVGLADGTSLPPLSGTDLATLSDTALVTTLAAGQSIFSRVTPEQKLRIVATLQGMGEIVAVTGDGVNDAPALKQADIGVAMGLVGTDVAREAADMVLVDDNFATIVAAIEEGRGIFDNMRKFIVYIFAHLAPEAIPFAIFALFRTPLPLTVMQILAIDLGTETLPALALGVESAEPDVMRRPPRSRKERLLDRPSLARGYILLGGLEAAVAIGAFVLLLTNAGWTWGEPSAPSPLVGDQATTVVFLAIVLLQVGAAFACRTERASVFSLGLLSNRFLLWGIAFELALAAALIYVPMLQRPFGTAPLELSWWVGIASVVPLLFLVDEGRKLLARRRGARSTGLARSTCTAGQPTSQNRE